jgi:hypothetical protein
MRLWDASEGRCFQVIEAYGDPGAIAGGPHSFPLYALAHDGETIVQDAATGLALGWFPVSFDHVATNPRMRSWCGVAHNHLYLITLEGAVV